MAVRERSRSNPRVVRYFGLFACATGGLSVLVAVVVLLDWVFGTGDTGGLLPGRITMKINTAISVAMMGLSLLASCWPRTRDTVVPRVLAFATLLVAVATLVQMVGRLDLGIDTLFHPDRGTIAVGRAPGRMSELSAMSLLLLGLAGLVAGRPRLHGLAQGASVGAIVISLYGLSILGYQAATPSAVTPFAPVALHAALLFIVLALGLLATRPEAGLMRVLSSDSFGGALTRRVLLPSLLIPSLLSFAAQWLQSNALIAPQTTLALLALTSGGLVAWLIWSAGSLLDRIEQQMRIARDLRQDANTDPLTGVGNRRAFDGSLGVSLQKCQATGEKFSLLMIDIDHFKAYNDNHGHPAGDEVLRRMGEALLAELRPGDLAARFGGEEFAVLLPSIDGERAVLVADRIRLHLAAADWPHDPVTVSIGAAQAHGDETAVQLLARADAALYRAKRGGRNCVVLDA
ncbi:GGDEF domain-containing protein [Arenimonas alkanexedens]